MRVSLFLGTLLIFECSFANTLQLDDYVAKFIAADENLAIAASELGEAQSQFLISSDLWQPTLNLTLSNSQVEQQQASTTIENSSDMTISLSQDLPYGLNSSVSIGQQLAEDNDSNADTFNSYSFSLTEDIWRNAFGRGERFLKQRDQELKSAAEFSYAWQNLETCQSAIELYIDAYTAQEEFKIYQNILQQAESALKLSRRARRQRLMRKIDLLSAEADYLRVKSLLQVSEREHKSKSYNLVNYANLQQAPVELVAPNYKFSEVNIDALNLKNNLQHRSIHKQTQARVFNRDYVKDSLRGEATIGFEIGRSSGQLSSTVNDEYDYATVSLSFDLPAFQESLDATYKAADYELQKYEMQSRLLKKELQDAYKKNAESLQANVKRLEINKEKLKIYSQQVKEAYRLLGAGKMEFEDYVRFRDLLLNEKLNQLKLEKESWASLTELWKLNNNKTEICRGQG